MGISNRTAALERKMSMLLGEKQKNLKEIERAERLYSQIHALRQRVGRIDELVFYCEEIIKDDQPDWTPERVKARKAHTHKIPLELGSATKKALAVLRDATCPLTIRDIAAEVLRRENISPVGRELLDRVSDTIGNQFRKRPRTYLANDNGWPARWWVVRNGVVGKDE